MNSSFPRIVTLLRKERKITQKQAASDLGVSQALLSHYEKGIREPGLNFLIKCADYYDVSCDYLLGRSPEPSGQTLSVDEIPAPEKMSGDNKLGASILVSLNKKLASNSVNVLFDLASKSSNPELVKLVSDSLFLSIYTMFRQIYSANKDNNQDLFKISKTLYKDLSVAHLLRDGAYMSSILKKDDNGCKTLSISTESLSKDYPLFASSLLNLIKNAEISLEELNK